MTAGCAPAASPRRPTPLMGWPRPRCALGRRLGGRSSTPVLRRRSTTGLGRFDPVARLVGRVNADGRGSGLGLGGRWRGASSSEVRSPGGCVRFALVASTYVRLRSTLPGPCHYSKFEYKSTRTELMRQHRTDSLPLIPPSKIYPISFNFTDKTRKINRTIKFQQILTSY